MTASVAGREALHALRRAYWFYCAYRVEKVLLDLRDSVERKYGYDPNQPRVPAGNPHGGQWTDGGGSASGRSSDERLVRLTQARGGRRSLGLSGYVTLRNGSRVPATLRQESELLGLRLALTRLERQIRNFDPNWRLPSSLTETVRGEIAAARDEVRSAENHLFELRLRAVGPGPYATESIPSRGPNVKLRKGEQAELNQIGRCHTCGTTDPGTRSGNFVGDHQEPSALARPGQSQRIFPQCLSCSSSQGGHVNALTHSRRREKK